MPILKMPTRIRTAGRQKVIPHADFLMKSTSDVAERCIPNTTIVFCIPSHSPHTAFHQRLPLVKKLRGGALLFLGHDLVQIQNQPRHGGVGGQFSRVELRVARRGADF